MLKRPPLNASPTASPARMYGVDQISVSEMESARPSEPCQSPPYASSGSPPVTQISSAPAASPVSTASACTNSVCAREGRLIGAQEGPTPRPPPRRDGEGAQAARLPLSIATGRGPGGGADVVPC